MMTIYKQFEHFVVAYVLNNSYLNAGAGSTSSLDFRTLVNPMNGTMSLASTGANTLQITDCDNYKPAYVWVFKKGDVRYYPFMQSRRNKSNLHPGTNPDVRENPRNAYTTAKTGEKSTISISFNGVPYVLGFNTNDINTNALQLIGMENPDHDDNNVPGIDPPAQSAISITITAFQLEEGVSAPTGTFGIGIGYYPVRENPARDKGKYIVY